jgi:hypothetical protein
MDNNSDELLNQYVGRLVRIIVDDRWFYHGKFVSFNDREMELDDVKDGHMIISRNRRYIVRELNPRDKLRLAAKMSSPEILLDANKLEQNIYAFWDKNREDAKKIVQVLSELMKGQPKK